MRDAVSPTNTSFLLASFAAPKIQSPAIMSTRLTDLPAERIERSILLIRGHKVLLDADLAVLYGVTTFNLNKAVRRNIDRFPGDFMFQLTVVEAGSLRFQIGMSKPEGEVEDDICLTSLLSKGLPCFPVCYEANAQSK